MTRPQFSLRTLLIVVAVAGTALGIGGKWLRDKWQKEKDRDRRATPKDLVQFALAVEIYFPHTLIDQYRMDGMNKKPQYAWYSLRRPLKWWHIVGFLFFILCGVADTLYVTFARVREEAKSMPQPTESTDEDVPPTSCK